MVMRNSKRGNFIPRPVVATDVVAAILQWPGLYEDVNGKRFLGSPVSEVPTRLRDCGWRNVSHLNHTSDYEKMGLVVTSARYVGGVHAKRFCQVVYAKEASNGR